MRGIVFLLLLGLSLVAGAAEEVETTNTLRVMTYNIHHDKRQSRRLTAEAFKRRNFFSKFFDHFFGLFRSQL